MTKQPKFQSKLPKPASKKQEKKEQIKKSVELSKRGLYYVF
jgi:hypothetical protein